MSAVIYAAIVVMWAVVLVPMWLRRHDAATESRSVDRFSTAMRTLSRRTTSGPGRRYVVMPRRNDGGMSVHVSGAAMAERVQRRPVTARAPQAMAEPQAQPRRPAAPRPATRRPATRGKASIVARRRRLLLGMLALTYLTMLLAVAGVVSWPLQIVVDVILVAFCIHLRGQARQAAAVSRQRRRATVATTEAQAPARPRARPEAPQLERPPAVEPMGEPIEQALAATGTDATPESFADADPTWDPVPVPRPTYTLKPPAYVPPTYEVDPLRDTDPHTQVVGAEVIASEPAEAEAESDLDDILERRWAVND